MQYRLSFKARADTTCTISAALQQNHSPWNSWFWQSVTLTDTVRHFTLDTIHVSADDDASLKFAIGNSDGTYFWFDSVVFMEKRLPVVEDTSGQKMKTIPSNSHIHLTIYPNPANDQCTISFLLSEKKHIEAFLTDISGRQINLLADGKYTPGNHTIRTSLKGFQPGFYLIELIVDGKIRECRRLVIHP